MNSRPTALSDGQRRRLARLRRRRDREREGRVLVEGVRAVQEALDSGTRIHLALCAPRLSELRGGAALAQALVGAATELVSIDDEELATYADTEAPQGVVVVAEEPRAPSLEETLGKGLIQVALDGIQDPGNVGALVRSAAAFGVTPVLLPGSADPWGPKAVRASAGTVFRNPPLRCAEGEWLGWIAERGVTLCIADAAGDPIDRVWTGRSEHRLALVVGNEGSGVGEALRSVAHRKVAVPFAKGVESLNVAVAGSILMYALRSGLSQGSDARA